MVDRLAVMAGTLAGRTYLLSRWHSGAQADLQHFRERAQALIAREKAYELALFSLQMEQYCDKLLTTARRELGLPEVEACNSRTGASASRSGRIAVRHT